MGVPIASTPATTTSEWCLRLSSQHGAFYAAGRYWLFYIDATEGDAYYKTSSDGENWSSATLLADIAHGGATFDVVFDGTYVHYIRNLSFSFPYYRGLAYRRGTPQSDGSISWSAAEQTVYYTTIAEDVQLAIDSGGYPWIGHSYSTFRYPSITKSSTNDGTWSTASGFPHYFFFSSNWWVIPVPQTSGKMYCLVYQTEGSESTIRGYAWNGSTWGSQEVATSSLLSNGVGDGIFGMLSTVAIGDDIHLAFMASNDDIKYVKRVGSWGSEETIEGTTCDVHSSPVLTKRTNNDLICYWLHNTDKAYYKKCVSGAWDGSPTELFDETADGFTLEYLLQSYYEELSGNIVLVYQTKTSSPYNIRHVIGEVAGGAEYTRSGTAYLGLAGSGTRPIACVRSDTGLLGLLATATRSWALSRGDTALLGLKATADRILTPIRAQTALLGLEATASRAVDYAAETGTALLGLLATGSRAIALGRSKTVLLGLKATAIVTTSLGHYFKEAVVYLGLAVTGTRPIVLARVDTALLGLKATATKAITLTRADTALLGLKATGTLLMPYIRTATVYLGLKITASRSFALTRLGTALLGLKAAATRSLVLSRAKTALLGLKVIGRYGHPGRALKLIIVTAQNRKLNVLTSLYRKLKILTE